MMIRAFVTAAVIGSSLVAMAAPVKKTWRAKPKFTIQAGGTLLIDNPIGDVQVVGTDAGQVQAVITRTVTGADADAVEEGRKNTLYSIGGDDRMRVGRVTIAGHTKQWSANVTWQLTVPRNVAVRIVSGSSKTILVRDVLGDIFVRNVNGTVVLENVASSAIVESANGSIIYSASPMRGNARLSSVNGNITATLPPETNFRWVAETLKGDIRTTFPARGAFFGSTFRGSINAPGGPTLSTFSLMGNVNVVGAGAPQQQIQSIKRPTPSNVIPAFMTTGGAPMPVPQVHGRDLYRYRTNLGDVKIPEIAADAEIFTGAGEVQLGSVSGSATVVSFGGPLQFGEITGKLNASTRAGDILVDSAKSGGVLATKGGTIRVLYTSGATRLESGGGDIIVRQAAAQVHAETRSGDIWLTIDPASKTETITAFTAKGNIVLNVPARFGADVDVTIETLDPNADSILSDLPGLTISRQQIAGGRTRIKGVGKLNGGGEKVTLQAVSGDIRITTAGISPTVIAPK